MGWGRKNILKKTKNKTTELSAETNDSVASRELASGLRSLFEELLIEHTYT